MSEQFKKGLAVRRDVLGKDYVDNSLAKADDFMMAFQGITTEWCWGYAWTRPGLDRKTRSLLNLAGEGASFCAGADMDLLKQIATAGGIEGVRSSLGHTVLMPRSMAKRTTASPRM